MKKYLLSPLLGLFVVVAGLAVTTSASAFELRNLYLGVCLGVAGGNSNPGGQLILWTCDGSTNQDFTAVPTSYAPYANSRGEQLYTLYDNVAGNRVLGVAPVANGSISAPVVTWTPDYSANQQWTMTYVTTDFYGHACYAIRSNGTLTMLTPAADNTTIQSPYAQWYNAGRWGQVGMGQSAVASKYIFVPYDPYIPASQAPFYDPMHYSVQYWCVY